MTTPGQFRRIEECFHRLSELDEGEQREQLVALHRREPEVAERVQRMLAVTDLELPTLSEGLDLAGHGEPPPHIPPYRLLRLLGVGGMGEVWEAEQTEPLRRRVAIKLVRSGLDQRAVLERFRSERQALAIMDHPGIAKVFEAGADDRGRPFFVMELVEGESIHHYAARHRLTVADRLSLLARVCDAVQHAHRRGVIHRDLKPSNILVSGPPTAARPKIIDFGIAKAIDPASPLGETASPLTVLGQPLGTLDYMSPEQAAGTGVDTRTDVYALGVLLYQLLVGATPFRRPGEQVSQGEMQRRIASDDPIRLRTALRHLGAELEPLAARRDSDGRTLSRAVRGDLEWIVSRALHRDPERRYDSPQALADDLRRHLELRPVVAGPDALGYRLGKLVRRRRGAVLAVAAILVAATIAASGLLVGWVRSERAREQALAEAAESDATRDFLLSLFEVADPENDSPPDLTAPDLLARGADRLRSDLDGQPDLEASLSQTIGRLYLKLGLFAEATEHLERAVALRERVGRAEPLAEAVLELARHRMDTGDYQAAAAAYQRAADLLRTSATPQGRTTRIRALTELSAAQRMLNRFDLGLLSSQTALDLAPEVLPEDSPSHVPVLSNHAALLWATGDLDGAGMHWTRAIEHTRRHFGSDHHFMGSLLQNLAALRRDQGRYEQSIRLLREAERLDSERYGSDHPWLATLRVSLAEALIAVGELSSAERSLQRALEVLEDSGGGGLEYALLQLGRLRQSQGRWQDSLPILHSALDTARTAFGELHQDTALVWATLATTLRQLGDLEEAERYARQAIDVVDKVHSAPPTVRVPYLLELARIESTRGGFARAEELTREGIATLRRHGATPGSPAVLEARALLAEIWSQQGLGDQARDLARELLAAAQELEARHPVRTAVTAAASRLGVGSPD
ncbi:MAG: hypothetical protein DWQ36_03355 [Acidobacteria bacterium]|nr:MAG: hypothetical protein DWQ36_03355 [Acidobacteriota bacterium]